MKLLFGTGNEYKYNLMKERLKSLEEIEVVNPKMLGIKIDIDENGLTAEENACIKAKAYFEACKMPVIAEDSGLFIDKFKDDEQPGLFVKRVNGKENLSDEEVLNYYIEKLNKYGGESLANYFTGVCIIDENGKLFSKTINETKFLLTTKKSNVKTISGGVLECISFDINANKYFHERTEEDKKNHYKKLDEEYRALIKKVLLKS